MTSRVFSSFAGFALALSLSTGIHAQESAPAAPKETAVPAPAPAPAPTPVATPAAAAAPSKPANAPVAEAPKYSEAVQTAIGPLVAGKGRIVFFRPSKFAGGAVSFIVREKEKELGKLKSGSYFITQETPGKHTYVVHSEAQDLTTIEVEDGETYFVAGSISMGFLAGHPHLNVADLAAFEAALPKMKLSAPLD